MYYKNLTTTPSNTMNIIKERNIERLKMKQGKMETTIDMSDIETMLTKEEYEAVLQVRKKKEEDKYFFILFNVVKSMLKELGFSRTWKIIHRISCELDGIRRHPEQYKEYFKLTK